MTWNFVYFYRDSFGRKHMSEKLFECSDLIEATRKFCCFCKKNKFDIVSFYID